MRIVSPTTPSLEEKEKELARSHWGLVTFLAIVIVAGVLLAALTVHAADTFNNW
jgi:hypothetical protein